MLVKSVDLPKFSSTVQTMNKYNRKKNVQTKLEYDPVNITFFDDNFGVSTALMEAYYKYYFADANHSLNDGSYGNRRTGDTTYDGPGTNSFKFGMDNNTPSVPFLDRIEIAQLSRKSFTKFTLVNPIISEWQHDTLDNSDGGGVMENALTVAFDTVFYDRGNVEAGANGDPAGFGRADHYDTTPSPISLLGGGTLGIDGIFGAGLDLYEYITKGKNFSNPLEAGIAAANLFGNVRNLSSDGLRQGGMRILTNAIGDAAGIDVSGVAQTFFPKNSGNGGIKDILVATAVAGGVSAFTANLQQRSTTTGDTNPQNTEDAQFQNFKKEYLNNGGGGGVNGARASFNALPTSEKAKYN